MTKFFTAETFAEKYFLCKWAFFSDATYPGIDFLATYCYPKGFRSYSVLEEFILQFFMKNKTMKSCVDC